MGEILIKRVYDPVADDGYRVLVDRLWPRGTSKEKAALDLWAKSVAPSNELRKEYHDNLEKYDSFRNKYLDELKDNKDAEAFVSTIRTRLKEDNVTFLTASKNTEKNHATVLRDLIGN